MILVGVIPVLVAYLSSRNGNQVYDNLIYNGSEESVLAPVLLIHRSIITTYTICSNRTLMNRGPLRLASQWAVFVSVDLSYAVFVLKRSLQITALNLPENPRTHVNRFDVIWNISYMQPRVMFKSFNVVRAGSRASDITNAITNQWLKRVLKAGRYR